MRHCQLIFKLRLRLIDAQAELASTKSVLGRLLKIADKTANLCSMQESTPSGWSKE